VSAARTRASFDALLDEIAERVAYRLEQTSTPAMPETEAWRLLTLVEVSERLGRSERWVRDRVKAGDLARVRLDEGAFAFLLEDVIAFAECRRIGAMELV